VLDLADHQHLVHLRDRAFTTALLQSFPETGRMEQERQRALAGLRLLIERAQAAGDLRSDFATEDIELLLQAHEGVLSRSGHDAAASAHLADLLLDACRPRST
jgi:hypothetical protein